MQPDQASAMSVIPTLQDDLTVAMHALVPSLGAADILLGMWVDAYYIMNLCRAACQLLCQLQQM